MKKMYLFLLCLVLGPGSVFASPVPGIDAESPEFLPPPIDGDLPVQPKVEAQFSQVSQPINRPIDLKDAESLSGAPYFSLLKDLGITPIPETPYEEPEGGDVAIEQAQDPSFLGEWQAVNDDNQDVEPSVIAITRNGVDYITTCYIKFVGSDPRNYFSTTTDLVNFTRGQLPMPSGYQRSADPLLSENPYTNGIAPGRIYLTGIVFNTDTTSGYGPSGVVVWRSDDGGVSWYQPQFVESTSNPDLFLDKPAITVSWYSGTRGYVYVAYIRINRGTPDELVVARSTNGGETFGTPIVVATGDGIQGPQVLADYYHGNVYVLWADRTLEAIQMSTSNDYGQTWTPPEEVATGDIMGGGKKEWLKGGVRAGTLPMARFNWIANRICVVWHEREQPGTNLTDVYYTAKGPSGWQAKVMVNDNQVRDQFMPALDFDVSGRIKVVFYDRRDDASNFRYHLYTAYITSNGTLVRANGRLSTFSSDPRLYTSHTGFAGFIGDYQDIWDHQYSFGEHYISSWVGIPSVGDIYLTAMSPN